MSEITDILAVSSLFAGCDRHELDTIAEVVTDRTFEPGHVIVHEGDKTAAAMWVIADGEVEVSTGGHVITTLDEGEVFGEMALLEHEPQPRSADVIAKTEVRALQLTRWDLRGVIAEYPEIAMKMVHTVAERLRETDHALSE